MRSRDGGPLASRPAMRARCSPWRLAAASLTQIHANTLATFTWVENKGSRTHAESGTLSLTLPGSVTALFSVPFTQVSQSSAPDLTESSYTFSDGTSLALSGLTNFEFTNASGNPYRAPPGRRRPQAMAASA